MKLKKKNQKGTTLVEVIVASALLLIMSGTISLALSTVFDGYILSQQAGSVEQDSKLILSRVRYAGKKHNDATILSDQSKENFSKEGAVFDGVLLSTGEHTFLALEDGQVQGDFVSSIHSLDASKRINRVVSIGNSSSVAAKLKVQISGYNKVGGTCPDTVSGFVGPDKTPTSWFESTIEEVQESQSGVFINPAECIRYKVVLERDSEDVDSPKFFAIRLE